MGLKLATGTPLVFLVLPRFTFGTFALLKLSLEEIPSMATPMLVASLGVHAESSLNCAPNKNGSWLLAASSSSTKAAALN